MSGYQFQAPKVGYDNLANSVKNKIGKNQKTVTYNTVATQQSSQDMVQGRVKISDSDSDFDYLKNKLLPASGSIVSLSQDAIVDQNQCLNLDLLVPSGYIVCGNPGGQATTTNNFCIVGGAPVIQGNSIGLSSANIVLDKLPTTTNSPNLSIGADNKLSKTSGSISKIASSDNSSTVVCTTDNVLMTGRNSTLKLVSSQNETGFEFNVADTTGTRRSVINCKTATEGSQVSIGSYGTASTFSKSELFGDNVEFTANKGYLNLIFSNRSATQGNITARCFEYDSSNSLTGAYDLLKIQYLSSLLNLSLSKLPTDTGGTDSLSIDSNGLVYRKPNGGTGVETRTDIYPQLALINDSSFRVISPSNLYTIPNNTAVKFELYIIGIVDPNYVSQSVCYYCQGLIYKRGINAATIVDSSITVQCASADTTLFTGLKGTLSIVNNQLQYTVSGISNRTLHYSGYIRYYISKF